MVRCRASADALAYDGSIGRPNEPAEVSRCVQGHDKLPSGAKLPGRKFFHLAASAAELPAISLARAQTYAGAVPGGRRGADSRRKIRWPSRLFRGISMACEDLVVGCFLDDRAPLAVPELNRERTLKYLECCYKQGMSWKDAEQQIQDCLQQRGVPREGILRQLKLARSLLQPVVRLISFV